MLKLPVKNPKKSRILPNSNLKRQTSPWNSMSEKTKAKQLDAPARAKEVAKHFRKNLFNFYESPSSQSNEVILAPQAMSQEQNLEKNDQLFGEEVHSEGFFLCPSCTCWFTTKADLNFHIKNWCDR